MLDSFEISFIHILEAEGIGFTDHATDKGGPTIHGLSSRFLASYFGRYLAYHEIKAITVDEAREIYRESFWDTLRLSEISPRLAMVIFDQAVNRGVRAVTLSIQRATGTKQDGVFGPVTFKALASSDPTLTAWDIIKDSKQAYFKIVAYDSSQSANLQGWINRLFRLIEKTVVPE